jgi:hypothetical protein
MKKKLIQKFLAAGAALAGLVAAPEVGAQTSVFFVGGNSSQSVLFDRVTNVLNGTALSIKEIPAAPGAPGRRIAGGSGRRRAP